MLLCDSANHKQLKRTKQRKQFEKAKRYKSKVNTKMLIKLGWVWGGWQSKASFIHFHYTMKCKKKKSNVKKCQAKTTASLKAKGTR